MFLALLHFALQGCGAVLLYYLRFKKGKKVSYFLTLYFRLPIKRSELRADFVFFLVSQQSHLKPQRTFLFIVKIIIYRDLF